MTRRTHAPTPRRLAAPALVSALLLVLSGCMKVDVDLTLNEDETTDGVLVMGVSDEVADMLGREPQELWDELGAEMQADLPGSATSEPYTEDGYTGARVTFEDEPLGGFAAAGANGDALAITREDDEYVVSGAMDMTGQGSRMNGMPEPVIESLQLNVAVTFPGEVTEHNGTLEGSTVAWTPRMGERNEISARGAVSTDPGAGLSWVWLGVGALAVLTLAAAGVLRSRARATGHPPVGGRPEETSPTAPGASTWSRAGAGPEEPEPR